jgi:hypothetical protein
MIEPRRMQGVLAVTNAGNRISPLSHPLESFNLCRVGIAASIQVQTVRREETYFMRNVVSI